LGLKIMAGINRLGSRTARAVLPVADVILWRVIERGKVSLGYRKRLAGKAGLWFARRYDPAAKSYVKQTLGTADDIADADGARVLNFGQAQKAAMGKAAKPVTAGTALTVADCCAAYINAAHAEGRHMVVETEQRLRVHVLPKLGALRVDQLTTEKLTAWRDAMAAQPARIRSAPGKPQQYQKPPVTADAKRARRASVNRVAAILRAALNMAFRAGKVHDDLAWRRLKPFGKTASRRPGFLTAQESTRLINAANGTEPGFGALLHGALLTGARYSELCRLLVRDFEHGRVSVHQSKTGKGRSVRLSQQGRDFFAAHTVGRNPAEPMFKRPNGQPFAPSHQKRRMAAACAAANIVPGIPFHSLRHTYASLAIMNGTPMLVVANNLGHADTRMCEKHYGHLTSSYMDEAIDKGAPTFDVPLPNANVVAL